MGTTHGFGVDVGGSGVKAAPVDLRSGELAGERLRISTPQPATPEAVVGVVAEVVARHGWPSRVGVTLPCVLRKGTAFTAANVDPAWIGTDAAGLFAGTLSRPVAVLNDADAAGIAEMRYGVGRDHRGVVVLLTFGTGIGSAVFVDRMLLPNTELGHLEVNGQDAERRAAASVRQAEGLSWPDWARRVSEYLRRLEELLWPDLIVAGGGVSRKAEKWIPLLECRTEVVPAALLNTAGIVGAALAAEEGLAP